MSPKPTVLLCTSNGVGLGHLSRVMAVGQHLRQDMQVVIFTLSAAVSIPVSQGFLTEYLRSHEYSEFDGRTWNGLLDRRLEHLHTMYEPDLVLFDGTHPYAGLCRYLDRHRDLVRVWERRGMWRAGQGDAALSRSAHFDLVVEPGDYAAEYDMGPTVELTRDVERFAPIRYGAEPLTREAARVELGLDPDGPVALVQLGAGQINDVGSLLRRVVDRLTASGVFVVVAASVLAEKPDVDVPGVSVVQKYPISDFFAAFDMGFFAGGYNSFHEALSLQLPSVFVPNLKTKLDDQAARTRWAHDRGFGFDWHDGSAATLDDLLGRILDSSERDRLRVAMSTLRPAIGGSDVASRLAELVGRT